MNSGSTLEPVYDMDGIQIYHGDCLEVLPLLEQVDHVITDPPYARDVYVRLGSGTVQTANKYRSTESRERGAQRSGIRDGITRMAAGDIGFIDDMIVPLSVEFARLANRWVLAFSDVESCHLWRLALETAGLRYVRTGAWAKPDPMPQFSGDRPAVGFEPCTIAHAQGAMRWNGGGHAALWTHFTAKGAERPDHPCPKPLPLMRELIEQFTDPGDLVLDPFMGSGTTLRAAKDCGRRAIGIELNETYVQVAIDRLRQSVLAL